MLTHSQSYAIEGGQAGKARLSVLADVLQPTTLALLQRVGLQPGMACVDIGCGGGDVTRLLAHQVGRQGRVVGLDFDATILRLAEQDAQAEHLSQVTFQVASIFDWQPQPVFDLVYARFLLTHLSNPAQALVKMRQALKPGGLLVVEDIEMSGRFCYPPATSFAQGSDLYRTIVQHKGGDPDIGPKLPGMIGMAGFGEIGINLVQPIFLSGAGKAMMSLTLQRMTNAILAEGLATVLELEALLVELVAFESRPDTLVSLPRIFQVWGRVL